MKKIMFNDKYGLTQAVLEGRKTMTRRTIKLNATDEEYLDTAFDWDLRESVIIDRYSKYRIGEEVAVAQSYIDIMEYYHSLGSFDSRTESERESIFWCKMREFETYGNDSAMRGDLNKMFVRAELMPFRIRITDIKVEKLQDISDEDCIKEGISKIPWFGGYTYDIIKVMNSSRWTAYTTAKAAFSALIDKVSGKGTWERNPYVFVYEFELLKGGQQ